MRRSVHGIFLLDKPMNMTSNGALQQVKRLFNAKKAGHTGSLDPLATGMLPICLGEATKFSQFLLESDKRYAVVARLGVQTTTGDREGEIVSTQTVTGVTAERLQQVMQTFLGETEQIPPMYSAIKYQGKPLYELARRGIAIERAARTIHIHEINLESWEDLHFSFEVHCSKGTYVRTLVEDIGRHLGFGAHVTALRRVSVSPYQGAVMYTLSDLEAISAEAGNHQALDTLLLSAGTAVKTYPAVQLSASAEFYLRMGQAVRANFPMQAKLVCLYSHNDQFLGVGEVLADGRVKPHRLFAQPEVRA